MADIENNVAVADVAPTPEQVRAELDQQAILSGILPTPKEGAASGLPPVSGQPAAGPQQQDPAKPSFSFDVFKEKFGIDTPETLITEFEQLRALKDTPPTYEFENEESKNIFELLRTGKSREAFKVWEQKERLDDLLNLEVNKDTASEIVKHGMQLKYKDLKPAEIEYMFKKKHGMPPKPVQSQDDDEAAYQEKVSAWKEVVADKEMELLIEAKMVRPELEQSKTKFVFPEIEQQPQQEYLDYKKAVEENSKLAAEAVKVYKAMTPAAVETKVNFNDEANGIAFDFQFIPDAESFGKAVDMVTDMEKFYDQFLNPDGSPDRNKFLKTIYNAINMEKVVTQAMNQAKNATLKALLPDNSSGGLIRQLNLPVEPTEIDKGMAQAGIKRK